MPRGLWVMEESCEEVHDGTWEQEGTGAPTPSSGTTRLRKIFFYLKRAKTNHIGTIPNRLYCTKEPYKGTTISKDVYQKAFGKQNNLSILETYLAKRYPSSREGVNLGVWGVQCISESNNLLKT